MYQPDPLPKTPRQLWIVVALAVVLVAMLVPVALGKAQEWRVSLPRTLRLSRPERSLGPTDGPASHSGQTAPDAEPSAPPVTPSPTVAPSPSPRATPTSPPREDHYWLRRPIAATHNDTVARTYPYASRLDGTYPIHHGVEFVNAMGTEILAVADGTILVAGDDERQVYGARDGFYGYLVIQRIERELYGLPVYALYGHLSEIGVSPGQSVAAGEVIGEVGMSGYAEGP
ncbi:MAG: peptidoglycan DD-metalloendopeptidase family protein, partial [Anaerolineae bacterium]|nr:peptidoglycan DD-metalloendopeptidase family protein [Anaerolineae bacterium]